MLYTERMECTLLENIDGIEITFLPEDKSKLEALMKLLGFKMINHNAKIINKWHSLHLCDWRNYWMFDILNKKSKTPITIDEWREAIKWKKEFLKS